MTRLTLLTEIPAPYRIPLFNALAGRVDLRVLFLRERNPDRPFDLHRDELHFAWDVLPGFDVTVGGRWIVLNAGVLRRLRDADALVLGGWNQPAFLTAAAWARRRRVPTFYWVESTGHDARSGRLEGAKRGLLRSAAGFVVPGTAAREYLEGLGIAPDRIATAPNAVDAKIFGSAVRTRTDGPCRILAVARLSPEKGVDVLVRAAAGLPAEVVIAGSGPEEQRLRELAGPNVTFLGNVERDALPQLYADADVVVVPSRSDTWGMALNEAAIAGLPLVSSTVVGGSRDLIEEGVNGFRVAPDNPEALRRPLQRLVEDEGLRMSAGARSREISERFTPEAWADAVVAAVTTLPDR
ncbi:MAG: glycosyltransferase family 4 protein [Gaiellaceae bacterium]